MFYIVETGKVVNIIDGDTVVLKNKNKTVVNLVAVDAPKPGEAFGDIARNKLAELVLNQKVEVLVSPGQYNSKELKELVGIVEVKGKDINHALIELGVARYKEPAIYSMSRYTACVYRIVEGESREAKRGLWQNGSH